MPEKLFYYAFPLVVVALVALIYQFGYPLLITLAVLAAFVGIFMIVGLTAFDLVGAKPAARKRAVAARPQAAGAVTGA